MNAPRGAVFLSYASEDSEAAQRIADALKATSIEVWFDKHELRGGDAWDRRIRQEIQNCALFIPIISANTQQRLEGYFRREWKLAIERTHDMAEQKPFLVPVVIDRTGDKEAIVPDVFRAVQWTHLPAGETPPGFVDRVQRLLSPTATAAPDGIRSPGGKSPSGAPARHGLIGRRTAMICGAASVVLLAVGFVGLERLRGAKPGVADAASIAVLPLVNESGDADQQYFSDGISEDLITALSQFPGLKVIGRASAFQFRESKEDSHSIGAKLGVARLLEGSVRRVGEVVRISAALIDTADGSTRWSARYDRPYRDLFALQDEITHSVTASIRTKLLPGGHSAAQSDRPPGGSLEAYNDLLQGRFYQRHNTEAGARKAIEFYTKAIQLDPRYALAWSRLANAWTDLAVTVLGAAPAKEARGKAREAVDRAVALSSDLADAHATRGYLLQFGDLNWREAEAEYRRAAELAPYNAGVKFFLGNLRATFGDLESAIDLTRQAIAADPLAIENHVWLAMYLVGLNRLDESERSVERAFELQPDAGGPYFLLTVIEVQRGRAKAALDAAQKESAGPYQLAALALAREIGNDRRGADSALRTLVDKHAEVAAYQIAVIYAQRKDADATFEWLDRAVSNRDSGLVSLLYDPFLLRYRDDPRFAALCRKVGLPLPRELGVKT